jgi:NAD(P)-dependent dehydrogenase (short-subunit alcohol dehydrogenase family)
MSGRLEGRRALVSAAADGLGKAYALAFARHGADVAIFDIDPKVGAVADEMRGHGVTVVVDVLDVCDTEGVKAFVDRAATELGGLDLVVCNAGIVRVGDATSDAWDKVLADYDALMDVNARGVYVTGAAAIPHLVASGGGDLINISTDHVHTCGYPEALDHADAPECPWAGAPRPPAGGGALAVYDASKWAVHGLTQGWSRLLAPYGVRVNAFGMGATTTPMYIGFMGKNPIPTIAMAPNDVAEVLVDLVCEGPTGRTGDSVQLWMGHPTVLPPVSLIGRLAPAVMPAGGAR